MIGGLWALGAAVAFSLSSIAIARAIERTGVRLATAIMLAAGTVVATVAATIFDGAQPLKSARMTGLLFFGAAGLLHFVGGWGAMNASIRRIGASRASAITGMTPLFAAVLAIVLLQEGLDLEMATGISAIVAGTYLVTTS